MQISNHTLAPNGWPSFDDESTEARQKILDFSVDERIRYAAQKLIAGHIIYFAFDQFPHPSPFELSIKNRVISLLKIHNYKVEEYADIDYDFSLNYDLNMNGWLEGIVVCIKND